MSKVETRERVNQLIDGVSSRNGLPKPKGHPPDSAAKPDVNL